VKTQSATAEDASGESRLLKGGDPIGWQPCLRTPLMHCALPPSEPPDGGCPRCIRLAVVGETQLRGSWNLSAIAQLQGFSSGSPAASPRRWSPKTVTTSLMVGRSKPGCDLCPALSFKDLHHPCLGGGRAEPELCLPHGSVGHLLLQHSGEKAVGTCSQSQGGPTRVNSDVNRVYALDGKSSVNLASHGHCAGVFIGI
jgi:hypothetical protein